MKDKMTTYDYIQRDVWDSCFTEGAGSVYLVNIEEDSELENNKVHISGICSQFKDVYTSWPTIYTKAVNAEELENVRAELQKFYVVSPVTMMPNYESDYITDFDEAVHIIGFCIALWERIDREADAEVVDKLIADSENNNRIYAERGQLVEMIAARNKMIASGRQCGNIVSDRETESRHTYFMDVEIVLETDKTDIEDIISLFSRYNIEIVPEKHIVLHHNKNICVSYEERINIPRIIWDVRNALSQITNVTAVSYLTMDNDDVELLDGDVLYFAYGTSDYDEKLKGLDLFRMNFLMY